MALRATNFEPLPSGERFFRWNIFAPCRLEMQKIRQTVAMDSETPPDMGQFSGDVLEWLELSARKRQRAG